MRPDRRSARRVPLQAACFSLAILPTAAWGAPPPEAPAGSDAGPDEELEGPEAEGSAPAVESPETPPEDPPAASPPRIDGGYYGGSIPVVVGFKRVMAFDTPAPFIGGGGYFRTGDAVLDWMTIGIEAGGFYAQSSESQTEAGGSLLVDFGFYPRPKTPWSVRTAFGFGAASVRDAAGRASGYGGAAFRVATRYEFFPRASKYRPQTGGGMGVGPELGYLANPPGRAGGPMSNTVYLALTFTWYRGR